MAVTVRCDHCGNQAEPGHQWLRVRVEPFYPHRIMSGAMNGPEVAVDEGYNEGLRAEVCSPHCAALALERQATILSAGYGRLAGAMARSAAALKEEGNDPLDREDS